MNINPIIKQLLKNRGIESEEDITEFLSDKPQKTYDPFLLPDMEAGVDLILSEIKKGSKICIYGDYDADGITSTALMTDVLSHITTEDKLSYYIPSRFEEGYGLNMDAVKAIADSGADFIITVDCGSVSKEEARYAEELGMRILVTDHHNITDVMADCLLINPKHPKSKYPFKELSGCGVAFKVAQAIRQKAGLPKSVLTEVLDLVAIGTIGDIMPLLDENRTMTKFGMKVINSGRRKGLLKLIEGVALKKGDVSSENISYVIVPHLNAAGRIDDASLAVELLRGRCGEERQYEIVADILRKNRLRRELQEKAFGLCTETIERDGLEDIVIIKAEDAHEGITGIVAGKIKETYYRPAVIVTPSGENPRYLKGTGRSIEGVDLYLLLKSQEDLFEKFGGHSGACGFLIKKEAFGKLENGLRKEMAAIREKKPDIFKRKYPVELKLDEESLTIELAEQFELLAPFGSKNRKPSIELETSTISDVKYMGDRQQHVRFTASSTESGAKIQCVLFGKAQYVDLPETPSRIIGSLDCSIWQGVKRLQFMVEDLRGNTI